MRSYPASRLSVRGIFFFLAAGLILLAPAALAQTKSVARPAAAAKASARPKLVVLIVVDQMRGDYVDKFRSQWSAGLKRLLDEGAWFREAAYPYAATETCVGHATISTGSFPATHGMIANAWFDRDSQKQVTCTADPKPGTRPMAEAPRRVVIPRCV